MVVQKFFDVFQAELTGVLAAPVLQRNADRAGFVVTGDVVATIATVTRDRSPTDVLNLTVLPFVSIIHSSTVFSCQNAFVTCDIASTLREVLGLQNLVHSVFTEP